MSYFIISTVNGVRQPGVTGVATAVQGRSQLAGLANAARQDGKLVSVISNGVGNCGTVTIRQERRVGKSSRQRYSYERSFVLVPESVLDSMLG